MNSIQDVEPVRAWNAQEQTTGEINQYRYDLFKGVKDADGRIEKIRSVGIASIRDGLSTYVVELRMFPGIRFYLLPSQKERTSGSDHLIMSRENSRRSDRKYFWSVIGEGWVLRGPNTGLMQLKWDLLGEEIYMNIKPYKVLPATKDGF